MVLKHVADYAGLFIITAAIFHAYRFRRGDLYVIHVAAVPDRLEHRIGETKDHDVLYGFLTEIMIDAVDLPFVQHLVDALIELARGLQVGTERLFDDHTRALLTVAFLGSQAGSSNALDQLLVSVRWRGQVKNPRGQDPAAALEALDQLLQPAKPIVLFIAAANIIESCSKLLPDRFVCQTGAGKLFDSVPHFFAKHIVAHFAAGITHHSEALRQAIFERQIVQRRNKLSFGEITGRAEYHQHAGVRPFRRARARMRNILVRIKNHSISLALPHDRQIHSATRR